MVGLDEKGEIVLREKVSRNRIAARLVNVPLSDRAPAATRGQNRRGSFDEAEALQMFQRTLRDYPTDYFARIVRDDGSVQIMQPALGPAADRA
jgi:hypothetical protein